MVRLTVTAKVVISTAPSLRGHNQPRHRSSSLLDMGVRRQ